MWLSVGVSSSILQRMSVVDTVIEKLAPYECIACQRLGDPLCAHCLSLAGSPPPARCAGCKKISSASQTCSTCKKWLPLGVIYVATTLDGIEERLLHAYKFDLQRSGSKAIVTLMKQVLEGGEYDVMTWVPTAPARIRSRGFDHARLLAKELAKHEGLPPMAQLLHRRSNVRQLGASRRERLEHMAEEFMPTNAPIKGKKVLLIDDVMTTGASLAAAAKMLKQMGARQVDGLIYAQKL